MSDTESWQDQIRSSHDGGKCGCGYVYISADSLTVSYPESRAAENRRQSGAMDLRSGRRTKSLPRGTSNANSNLPANQPLRTAARYGADELEIPNFRHEAITQAESRPSEKTYSRDGNRVETTQGSRSARPESRQHVKKDSGVSLPSRGHQPPKERKKQSRHDDDDYEDRSRRS